MTIIHATTVLAVAVALRKIRKSFVFTCTYWTCLSPPGSSWTVATTMLFYATPVLYPIEGLPEQYRDYAFINPLASIMELARVWMIDPSAQGPIAAAGGIVKLIPAIVIYVGICVLAVWVFRREAPRIAEDL